MDIAVKVKNFITDKCGIARGEKVLLGLSGGADSVCLFLLLLNMKEELGLEIYPVHVNHGIRGAEADRDEEFSKELCKKYGLNCESVSVDVPTLSKELGMSLEEAARSARYDVFFELAKKHDCKYVAVAHHMDDQAETVLFRLFRGSSVKGMCGMEPVAPLASTHNYSLPDKEQIKVIRPMLCIDKEEILSYLDDNKEAFCTDSTNEETEYSRNRIRHIIMPAAREVIPSAVSGICRNAAYMSRVEDFLAKCEDELAEKAVIYSDAMCRKSQDEKGKAVINIETIKQADPLIAERVIYRSICRVAGAKKDITSDHVREVMKLLELESGKSISVGYGITARRDYSDLILYSTDFCADDVYIIEEIHKKDQVVGMHREIKLPSGRALEMEIADYDPAEGFPKSDTEKWFDLCKIRTDIYIRKGISEDVAGAKIALYADGRGKELTSYFDSCKIPTYLRNEAELLCNREEVLWVIGGRGSEGFRLSSDTKRVLKVKIK